MILSVAAEHAAMSKKAAKQHNAHVAELVDAHGSGPCAFGCGGSSPSVGTSNGSFRCYPQQSSTVVDIEQHYAHVAELVDAHGSGPCAFGCRGSSPFVGTRSEQFSLLSAVK